MSVKVCPSTCSHVACMYVRGQTMNTEMNHGAKPCVAVTKLRVLEHAVVPLGMRV
jgi:hypothetical protein